MSDTNPAEPGGGTRPTGRTRGGTRATCRTDADRRRRCRCPDAADGHRSAAGAGLSCSGSLVRLGRVVAYGRRDRSRIRAGTVDPGIAVCFYLFNRIPAFLTLRGRSKTYQVETAADGRRYLTSANIEQRPMWMRAIWFICVGFWFGAILDGCRLRPVRADRDDAVRDCDVQSSRPR